MLAREKPSRAPLRIGYDPTSLDHYLLTRSEFPEGKVDQIAVPCPYGHLLSALLAGAIDCGIWHRVDIGLSFDLLPIMARAPEREGTLALLKECEIACLVFRKERLDVGNLVGLIDARTIQAAQIAARQESAAHMEILSKLIGEPRI
ncbi:YhfZ family protein [Mesorhizobium sp. ORM8.1]